MTTALAILHSDASPANTYEPPDSLSAGSDQHSLSAGSDQHSLSAGSDQHSLSAGSDQHSLYSGSDQHRLPRDRNADRLRLERHLLTGRQMMQARERQKDALSADDHLATASPLDLLLEGGLPRGGLVELVGRASTGRFALLLQSLAAATSLGENAALIDLGDSLEPRVAAAAGCDLSRLLWIRPRRIKEALLAAEAVLGCALPLIVLDLGLPPLPGGRGLEGHWLRLARLAQAQRCALLVATPYRVSGPCAQQVVELGERRGLWQGVGRTPRLLAGLRSQLSLIKGPNTLKPATVCSSAWQIDLPTAIAPTPPPPPPSPLPSAPNHPRAVVRS